MARRVAANEDNVAEVDSMDKELVRLDRHFLREGALVKARL